VGDIKKGAMLPGVEMACRYAQVRILDWQSVPCKVDHFPTLGDVEVMEGRVEGALEADGGADAADLS